MSAVFARVFRRAGVCTCVPFRAWVCMRVRECVSGDEGPKCAARVSKRGSQQRPPTSCTGVPRLCPPQGSPPQRCVSPSQVSEEPKATQVRLASASEETWARLESQVGTASGGLGGGGRPPRGEKPPPAVPSASPQASGGLGRQGHVSHKAPGMLMGSYCDKSF